MVAPVFGALKNTRRGPIATGLVLLLGYTLSAWYVWW
jgi:hypothetical protein